MEEDISDPTLKEVINLICMDNMEQMSHIDGGCSNHTDFILYDDGRLQEKDTHSQTKIDEPNDILSLPIESFQSRETLLCHVRRIALTLEYATVIKKSKKDKYVIIACDRGGIYRGSNIPIEQRKRKTASRLINCPFEIWGKRKFDGIWKVEIKNLLHNHEPSTDMFGHPSCHRFSEEELLRIKEMSKASIAPRQMFSSLRQSNPNIQAISRTVYNARVKITKESLSGRTIVQALLEELGQGDFIYDIEYDQKGHLTHLMFSHPISIALSKSYPYIFVMDCTYKTNKHKLPLLDIIGVSSFNKSFYSCFVFMQKEEVEDYV